MSMLIRGGRIIDGNGGVLPKADIRIDGGRIAEIGPNLAAAGAEVVDAAGMTVMPGLIDCHVHITMGETLSNPKSWTAFAKFQSEQEAGFLSASPKAARDVAARGLDFDDIRALVSQQHGADGAGDHRCQVDHANAREGSSHVQSFAAADLAAPGGVAMEAAGLRLPRGPCR